jgi:hypothetical protein
VSGQLHASGALPPRNGSRYPLDTRLFGPKIRCERCEENTHTQVTGLNAASLVLVESLLSLRHVSATGGPSSDIHDDVRKSVCVCAAETSRPSCDFHQGRRGCIEDSIAQ